MQYLNKPKASNNSRLSEKARLELCGLVVSRHGCQVCNFTYLKGMIGTAFLRFSTFFGPVTKSTWQYRKKVKEPTSGIAWLFPFTVLPNSSGIIRGTEDSAVALWRAGRSRRRRVVLNRPGRYVDIQCNS